MSHPKSEPLAGDLLWGVPSIAAELGIPLSRAYYLIARGAISVRKHTHKTITASRRELRRRFAGRSSDEPPEAA